MPFNPTYYDPKNTRTDLAVQFTGTDMDEVTQIINWVNDLGYTANWRCDYLNSVHMCPGGMDSHTLMIRLTPNSGIDLAVGPGFWIVLSNGALKVLSDESFRRDYHTSKQVESITGSTMFIGPISAPIPYEAKPGGIRFIPPEPEQEADSLSEMVDLLVEQEIARRAEKAKAELRRLGYNDERVKS